MDHDVVVRQKMTEQYLLDELDPQARHEFEEHFFDCRECALDVQAAALFVEQSKVALAEKPALQAAPLPSPRPKKPGWLGWLRPAVAAPVMALLLAVVGYQNLVTYPRMRQALSQPQVFPSWAALNVGTYGAGESIITTAPGAGFLLFLRIPIDAAYASYTADLYNPAGKLEWSLTIPASESQDRWPVQVPGANREAGTYQVAVRGTTAAGERKDIGRASFELKIQQ